MTSSVPTGAWGVSALFPQHATTRAAIGAGGGTLHDVVFGKCGSIMMVQSWVPVPRRQLQARLGAQGSLLVAVSAQGRRV